MHPKLHRWYTIGPLLLLAFGLRVWGVADHNIWWDEGIGIWLARMPLWDSVAWTAGDVHPPLLSMPPHLALTCRRGGIQPAISLGDPQPAHSTADLPAQENARRIRDRLSCGPAPDHLKVFDLVGTGDPDVCTGSTSGNRFALGGCVVVEEFRGWLCYAQHDQNRKGKVGTLDTVRGMYSRSLYTLYLTATVPIVTNLGYLALWLRRRRAGRGTAGIRAWATAQIAAAALFLPWALYALPRMHSWSSDTPFTLGFFVQLYSTILAVGDPLNLETHALLTVGSFLGLGLVIIALIWRFWRRTSYRYGGLVMLIAGLLLPPIVVAVISLPGLRFHFSRPLVPRYLLPLSACYSTLLAWGITELKRRMPGRPVWRRVMASGTATIAVVAAVSGLSSFYPGRVRRDDYATIAEVLRAHRRIDEAVLLYVDRDWPVFVAHYQGERNDLPYGAALSDPDITQALLLPIWERTAAMWLVSTPESLQADPTQAVPSGWQPIPYSHGHWSAARSR